MSRGARWRSRLLRESEARPPEAPNATRDNERVSGMLKRARRTSRPFLTRSPPRLVLAASAIILALADRGAMFRLEFTPVAMDDLQAMSL
jgi:hypothetical protein